MQAPLPPPSAHPAALDPFPVPLVRAASQCSHVDWPEQDVQIHALTRDYRIERYA
jgi:hypothetical protein